MGDFGDITRDIGDITGDIGREWETQWRFFCFMYLPLNEVRCFNIPTGRSNANSNSSMLGRNTRVWGKVKAT